MNLDRINKECFWEYNFTNEEIVRMAKSNNLKVKLFLLGKILANSTNLFSDLRIFSLKEIENLLEIIKIPNFKREYFERRKNLIEFYFFGKPLKVEELKWQA